MGRARARIDLPAQVSVAEALWYDLARWPTFVDGFGHVAKVEGDWPREGARLVWDSVPAGRGRVVETVSAYEVRAGQTVRVEDERILGTQTVRFTPRAADACVLEIELEYRVKQANPFTPLVDALFIRRAFGDALRRTLARFRRELRAEQELEQAAG